jgi:hypothetical protein
MAASTAQGAAAQSKSSKKKAKAVDRTASPAPPASPNVEKDSAADDAENSYVRELQK